jgi:hypothetical protein
MMATLSEKMAKVAKKLIEKDGRLVTIIKSKKTDTDALKPWRKNETPWIDGTEVQVKAIFVTPKSPTDFGQGSVTALGLVPLDARLSWLIFAEDSFPGENYKDYEYIKDGDEIWKITIYETLKPGDKAIIHLMGIEQ